MAVDASIPLQAAQVQIPDQLAMYGKGLALREAVDEQRSRQAQAQQQMALRQAFQGADTQTPEGQAALVQKVSAINPDYGMNLSSQFMSQRKAQMEQQNLQMQMQGHKLDSTIKQGQIVAGAFQGVISQYDDLVAKGASPEAAKLQVQPAYEQAISGIKQAGVERADMFKPEFNPDSLKNHINLWTPVEKQLQSKREQLELQMRGQQIATQDRRELETERHNRENEVRQSAQTNATIRLVSERAESSKVRRETVGHSRFTQDELDDFAKQALAGDKSVIAYFKNLGRGVQGGGDLVEFLKAFIAQGKSLGMTPEQRALATAEFSGLNAAERTLGTRSANAGMAVAEAQSAAKIAEDASASFKRTDFPAVNAAIKAYESNTGDPNVRKFGAAVNSLVNVYARAISPTGQPTVSDKDHARELLRDIDTPEQFKAVLGIMKQEMTAAQKTPGTVKNELRETFTGKPKDGQSPTVHWDDLK